MNQAKIGVLPSSSKKRKGPGEKVEPLAFSLHAIQHEEHYSTLIESLADAVFEFEGEVLVWCNDRVEEIYGYTRDELIGKNARFFFSGRRRCFRVRSRDL